MERHGLRAHHIRRICLRLGLALASLILPTTVAHAGGTFLDLAPGTILADSGKRNPVFYAGEPIQFHLTLAPAAASGPAPTRYEVRDYWGNQVEQGTVAKDSAGPVVAPHVTLPGWYKLNIYGGVSQAKVGTSLSGTTFTIFRRNPNFPDLPARNGGPQPMYFSDQVMRDVLGIGPQRLSADANNPAKSIADLDALIAIDKQYYTPYDPARKRVLMINFPDGTANLAGVRQIVDHFKNDVQYWEGRNEPNGDTWGATFATGEMKAFYQTVKSVSPSLKVLGPANVTIGPTGLIWLDSFFQAGGGNYIDALSFHAYNNTNGDLILARQSFDGLNALLAKYHLQNIEKWQTEQGFFAAMYGAYSPRHQGRWTMLQAMAFEQYGLPKEHNFYWYDCSHGYWDFPTWYENRDGSLNPAAPLMRTWSEEVYGTQFAKAYDFGPAGNQMYIGSLFAGSGKQVAAFMSNGSTDGKIQLSVMGGSSLHLVSAFGVETDLPVVNGVATLPVPEIPVYVELAAGQSIQVVPMDFGQDLALQPGVTVTTSGTGKHPLDATFPNSSSKIINGQLENWYWNMGDGDHPWMDDTVSFPATVQINLPIAEQVSHVIVYAGTPWQADGAPLNYELQYDSNGTWVTIQHVIEDPKTFVNYTCKWLTGTTVDTYYSDRCIFQHDFAPVVTKRLRLLVHDTTCGGGATPAVVAAGGQTGPHHLELREIEVYGPPQNLQTSFTISGRITDAQGRPVPGTPVSLVGHSVQTTQTDEAGAYAFTDLKAGTSALVTAAAGKSLCAPSQASFVALDTDKTADFQVVAGAGTGLTGQYYVDANRPFLEMTRVDPNIDFNWTSGFAPAPVISGKDSGYVNWLNRKNYSVRWSGQILAPYTATYTFSLTAPNGGRLWINGQPVIALGKASGTISLTAGQKYAIQAEGYEFSGAPVFQLSWSSDVSPKQVVPKDFLFATAPATTAVPNSPIPCPADVASGVTVQRSAVTYQASTKQYLQTVTLTNRAGFVEGPILVRFSNLPAGVSVANSVSNYNNQPWIVASTGDLGGGQSVQVQVRYTGASNGTQSAASFSAIGIQPSAGRLPN